LRSRFAIGGGSRDLGYDLVPRTTTSAPGSVGTAGACNRRQRFSDVGGRWRSRELAPVVV